MKRPLWFVIPVGVYFLAGIWLILHHSTVSDLLAVSGGSSEFRRRVENTAAVLSGHLQRSATLAPGSLPPQMGQYLDDIRRVEGWSSILFQTDDGLVFLQTGEADPRALDVQSVRVDTPRYGGVLRVTRHPRNTETGARGVMIVPGFLLLSAGLVILLIWRYLPVQSREKETIELRVVAAGLAHELRNPLNTIQFNLRMLEEDLEDEGVSRDTAELAMEIRRELERLDVLLGAWVTWATGGETRTPLEVDLVHFLDEVIGFVADEFGAAGVAFLRNYPPEGLTIRLDAEALRQVLLNLFRNAREAMPRGGAIHVTLESLADQGGVITIEDEGDGVARELRENIFEPFVSGRSNGSGLGLAVASRLIRGMGGTIKLQEGGRGACFRIQL